MLLDTQYHSIDISTIFLKKWYSKNTDLIFLIFLSDFLISIYSKKVEKIVSASKVSWSHKLDINQNDIHLTNFLSVHFEK